MKNEYGARMPMITGLMISGISGTSLYLSHSNTPEVDLGVALFMFGIIFAIVCFSMGRLVRKVSVFCPAPGGDMQMLLNRIHSIVGELGYAPLAATVAGRWEYDAKPVSNRSAGKRHLSIDVAGQGWLRVTGSAALIRIIKGQIYGTVYTPYTGPQHWIAWGKGFLAPCGIVLAFAVLYLAAIFPLTHHESGTVSERASDETPNSDRETPAHRNLEMFHPAALQGSNAISDPGGHYTLELPPHWIPMQPATLEEFRAELRNASLTGVEYVLGFVTDSRSKDPSWILVGRSPHVKLRDSEFKDPDFASHVMGYAKRDQRLSKVTSGMELLDSYYDDSRHLLWMNFDGPSPDGRISAWSGLYRTSDKSIQVNCYAPTNRFASHEAEFRSIIASLKIDDSLQYRQGTLERMFPDAGSFRRAALIACSVLLGLILIAGLKISAHNRRQPS